jgi:hypothetical protein
MSETRRGDWIQTYTGGAFWPLDPREDEIRLADISHALAFQCRFGGHCRRFYSVAEHCVLLSYLVEPQAALLALMHDAAEAYLVDLPRPVKRSLVGYEMIERQLELMIFKKFGVGLTYWEHVRDCDRRILTDEARQNMAPPPRPWSTLAAPLGATLMFWKPEDAEHYFARRYDALATTVEAT